MKTLQSRLISAISRAFTFTLGNIDLLLKTVIAASLLLLSIAAIQTVGVFDRAVDQYERRDRVGVFDRAVDQYERRDRGERQISVNFSRPIEIEPLLVSGDLEMNADVRLKCLETYPPLVDLDGDGIKEAMWYEERCAALLNNEKQVN